MLEKKAIGLNPKLKIQARAEGDLKALSGDRAFRKIVK